MKKKILSILLTSLLLLLLSISCSEEENRDTLPELPPVEALMMDFDLFIDNPAQGGAKKSLPTYNNALYSYLTVGIWNAIASAPLLVPVVAYVECIKQTPVYLGNNRWQWSYTLSGAETYTARLVTTRISNEEFTAEMFISLAGSYEDFMWFEGTVRYDRTHAEWTLYESPQNNVELLEIKWNMDWELEVSDLTYTLVKSGHEEEGSFITFGITDDAVYNAYYTISLSDRETFIEWNTTTKEGRVKDELNFGDSEWHCWDSNLQDVDCNP